MSHQDPAGVRHALRPGPVGKEAAGVHFADIALEVEVREVLTMTTVSPIRSVTAPPAGGGGQA
jgi:hypothetical protein